MTYIDKYKEWVISQHIAQKDRQELTAIKNNPEEIKDRFYKDLDFGTGGIRGKIGIGSNRINVYNVKKATQGLADYLLKNDDNTKSRGVAIAYDSRHYSDIFAKQTALVLAGNKIKAYLFTELRPTPELSFAVRHLGCAAGVVITASHNPPEYNGYKVYNGAGAQILPQEAHEITDAINSVGDWGLIKTADEEKALQSGLLRYIGSEIDEAYVNKVAGLAKSKRPSGGALDIIAVYTPLHGTGQAPVTKCLSKLGYNNIFTVESQSYPDGDFPTVKKPNPEDKEAFNLAIELATEKNADIVLATDPDGDRLGAAVKDKTGGYRLLSGNQIGALLTYYIVKFKNDITRNDILVKTIVTSDLGALIAASCGASVINTLTGFKYIGNEINDIHQNSRGQFLFAYEESYGYLAGDFVRDKDAVIAAALFTDMAAFYKGKGVCLLDVLENIYLEYGYFADELQTFDFEGAQGEEKVKQIMNIFRNYDYLFGHFENIKCIEDYETQEIYSAGGTVKQIKDLPESNVVKIVFNSSSWLAARPSGTEPKLKIYYSYNGKDSLQTIEKLNCCKNEIKKLFQT